MRYSTIFKKLNRLQEQENEDNKVIYPELLVLEYDIGSP